MSYGVTSNRVKTIVLIDDDRLITVLVKAFLVHTDINLITFNCPELGLKYVLENEVDMCITDLMMPKIDGFDICDQILEKKPLVKLAVLSFKKMSINEMHYLLANGICYFNKPVAPKFFRQHLDAFLFSKSECLIPDQVTAAH
jgi:two-component system, OmpR family, alkaline phosphatase synthesis response regulator PhoP